MASFRKRGKRWQAVVRRGDLKESRAFSTKADAIAWAAGLEADIEGAKSGKLSNKPFSAALKEYAEKVSPTKRGERWERFRLAAVEKDDIARVPLSELNGSHVAKWRDRRLKNVSRETVRREWNLLSNVCTVCVKEWKWLKQNPFSEVKQPAPGLHRQILITDQQVEALIVASGYPADTVSARVVAALLLALETGMRAGEICSLTAKSIKGTVAQLPVTKNGTARDVPLSTKAVEILKGYPDGLGLTPSQLDANFRKVRFNAGLSGFTFHDARHTAATRIAQKIHVLDLCRMFGWKNVRQATVYYNESAADIAKKL